MKKSSFFFIIIVLGLLQATLLNSFAVFNVKPDLLLVAAVISGLFFEEKSALIFGLIAGLSKDIFGIDRIAANAPLFALWAFLVSRLSRKICVENYFLRCLLVLIITALNAFLSRLLFLFAGNYIRWGVFLRTAFLEALYTALACPLLFKAIKF